MKYSNEIKVGRDLLENVGYEVERKKKL